MEIKSKYKFVNYYTQCDSVSCHYDINSRTLVGTLVEEV